MNDRESLDIAALHTSVARYYSERPQWITGYISFTDAQFLTQNIIDAKAHRVVEIGTASGLSTGLLCHVLNYLSQTGIIEPDFHVFSYDISPTFYAAPTRKVGDAAREQLPAKLLEHITFRNPATSIDIRKYHGPDTIKFMFVDACHQHPWPTLDLLATLDCLSPGATVVLHDVNLPVLKPQYQDWGAKYLFDELVIEKQKDTPANGGIYNIGRVVIPESKGHLRGQLLKILCDHDWQLKIPDEYLAELGIEMPTSRKAKQ